MHPQSLRRPCSHGKGIQKAIEAGREAREIGLAAKLAAATATSPLTGFLAQSTDRD